MQNAKIFLQFDKNMPNFEESNLDNNLIEPLGDDDNIEGGGAGGKEVLQEEFKKPEIEDASENLDSPPKEQLGELGKEIKDGTGEIEQTEDELNKLREELGLPQSTEEFLDADKGGKERKANRKEKEPMHTIWNRSGKEMIDLIISIPPSRRKIYQNLEEIEATSLKELKEKDFDPEKCFIVIYKAKDMEKIDVIVVGKKVEDKDVAKLIMMEIKDYFKDEEDALLRLGEERKKAMDREDKNEEQPEIFGNIPIESKPEGNDKHGGNDKSEE